MIMNKKRILLIDDEPGITRLLKLNLEQTGRYEVREENFGKRGLEAAREFKPDLILLDVMMPGMGGGDIAAGIKRDPDLKKTPIVFLTAAVKKEELGAAIGKIGGRTYIAKPLDVRGVLHLIERTLGTKGGTTP